MIDLDTTSPSGLSKEGRPFGSKTSNGLYWRIQIKGKQFYCYRIIWEKLNGPIPEGMTVDHVDKNGLNNAHSNLRLASKTLQIRNRGVWGEVSYKWVTKEKGKFRARWRKPDKSLHHAGFYDTALEAHLASCASRLELLWSL